MASLTGNQINNSYQGLLKTESNGALGAGLTNLTDGVGTATGLSLNTGANEFMYTRPNVEYSMKNTNFTRANYPMSATGGDASFLNFKDGNGAYVGWLSLDRYGSMYYTNTHGDQGESHVFKSQTGAGAGTPAIIRMDTYNSVNNSNNWYLGYQQSVDALTYNSGTGDLTLGRQDAADLVVNIPTGGGGGGVTSVNTLAGALTLAAGTGISITDNGTDTITVTATGGGGSAGLINGTGGIDSLISAPALTTNPALATQANAIAIGNGAEAYSSGVIAIGQSAGSTGGAHWGSISIGSNSVINSFGCIALGPSAQATGASSLAIGDAAISSASDSIAIGRTTQARGAESVVLGYNNNIASGVYNSAIVGARSSITGGGNHNAIGRSQAIQGGIGNSIVGGYSVTIPSGDRNTVIGANNISMPTLQNDNVVIGSAADAPGSGTSNSIGIGLVHRIYEDSTDSVAIGRGAEVGTKVAGVGNPGNNSVAIGYTAKCLNENATAVGASAEAHASQSTAVGFNVIATRSNYVAVNELDVTTVGGGIYLYSPNGTAWKLTVDNTGNLVVS